MSTMTPSRPTLPHPAAARPRGTAAIASTRTIDPFRILRRHLVLLVSTAIVGVIFGVVLYLLLNRFLPFYKTEVLFEIRSTLEEGRDITIRDIAQDDLVMRLASTESVLLTSREVLETAVKQPDVQSTHWFRRTFLGTGGTALIDEAVDELEEDISTKLVRGSNLFALNWSTRKAEDVPIVLNSIARAYIDRRTSLDEQVYNANMELFRSELNETSRKLDDLAQEIETFIREKGITTLQDPRNTQIALAMEALNQRIGEASSGLSLTQSSYLQAAAKLEGTMEPSEDDRRFAAQDAAVRPHELAVLESKTRLRELREQYRDPNQWLIRKEGSRLRALEMEYESKIGQIMTNNLHAQLKVLSDQLESYQSVLEQMEREYLEKDALQRTLAADISRYQAMEEKREHLEAVRQADLDVIKESRLMRLRADASRVRIAQWALTPREMAFPKIELVLPLTTVLLVGLVAGLIFLRELTDQRVKSVSDLELLPHARVLGVIPELAEDPCRSEAAELVVRKCPNSVLAESYRQGCALIDKRMNQAGHQTMLVVGALPDAGTTTVVTNLAAAAAAAGRRIAVVDANFRRPRLAQAMDVSPDGPGLGDLLADEVSLDQAITESEYGVDVITAGRPESRIFERLNNGQWARMIAELRGRYDLILVDAPPVMVAGDALVLANKLDAAVLVVRANREQRGLVARLINQLSDAQCELLGIVLNRPRGTAGGYFKKNFAAMASYTSNAGT